MREISFFKEDGHEQTCSVYLVNHDSISGKGKVKGYHKLDPKRNT